MDHPRPAPSTLVQAVSYLISCVVVLAALGGLWLHPQGVLSFAVPWDMEKVCLTLTLSPTITLSFIEMSMRLLLLKE